jgi:pimeloyl-ACP methyl ester carboxylesterase
MKFGNTRRQVLGAMVATSLMGQTTRVRARSGRKTFLLVHGSWHGGWCWRRVSDLLESSGHSVYSPTMTGLGERSHLLTRDINVSTHVEDVANVIRWEGLSDIVLVGHSYGGMVINGVAERMSDRISSIVFLDAFMPEDQESMLDRTSPVFKNMIGEAIARGDFALKSPSASVFGVEDKDRAWVDSKTTPQPVATFTERTKSTGSREKITKKAFIRAKNYSSATFDANLAKAAHDPTWRTFELASGHDAMVIAPGPLTKIILEVA